VIRSTFIVGFPGETESDFESLLEFLEAARLDRVGRFAYSPVTGPRPMSFPISYRRRFGRNAWRA